MNSDDRIARLEKRLQREIKAREIAEEFLERKSTELFESNRALQQFNKELEERVLARTQALDQQRLAAEKMAHQDHLTGLPNRLNLSTLLPQITNETGKNGNSFSLLAIDLDRFKHVNDSHGHDAGDLVLCGIAERLQEQTRNHEHVFRLGGDEFVVLIMGAANVADIAARLHTSLCAPISIGKAWVKLGASIGIARSPEHGQTADLLLKCADLAAYEAKRAGGGIRIYEQTFMDDTKKNAQLTDALDQAITSGKIEVWFQPIVCARSQKLIAAEALARWPQADGSYIPPFEFIPIAERAGLIDRLGMGVMRQALRAARPLILSEQLDYVSVNLSPFQLSHNDLGDRILGVLEDEDVEPHHLEIEITENLLLHDTPKVRTLMNQLAAFGVKFALDDFGVGYSNLRYLQELPVGKLKLDRCFLLDTESNPTTSKIISAITQLARQLSIQVVIEGVETEAQLQLACDLQCDLIQGYYIARPMPCAGFHSWAMTRPAEERRLSGTSVLNDKEPV